MSASVGEGARQTHALLHAARQFMAELARPLRQAHHGELVGDDLIHLLLRHAPKFEPEGDILLDRAPRQQSELLEHHGDAARAQHPEFVGAAMGDVDRSIAMADQHLAPRHFVEAIDGAQDRRLARSREAHQDADFARLDRKSDAGCAKNDSGRFEDLVARRAAIDHRERFGLLVAEHDVDVVENNRGHLTRFLFARGCGRRDRARSPRARSTRQPRCPSEC